MYGRFNQRTSIYTGISRPQLEAMLREAQRVQFEFSIGAKVVTATYAQGDGNKSVTYTMATLANLNSTILELMACLGIVRHARRPIRIGYW